MADARSAFAAQEAADLATAYASTTGVGTVACSDGTTTAYGFAELLILDDQDARGVVSGPRPVQLTVPAGTWSTLARKAAVTISAGALADSYTVDGHDTSPDGREDVYVLRRSP